MTTTHDIAATPRRPRIDRPVAMRLAATEYGRVVELLRTLAPADWSVRTDCPDWDVKAMVGHMLGMAEMAASIRQSMRQPRAAQRRGGVFIDALTALQVEEHDHLSPSELVERFAAIAPKAAKGRRRAPGFVRRRPMPQLQAVNGRDEAWTMGFLLDVILTRDPWMHRVDITRATGAQMTLTADHDGALVDDVVREWAGRHGQPYSLVLTGPAGRTWRGGADGAASEAEAIECDAVEFCRTVARRAPGAGLLATEVPF
jgi:uncharacterized protein (TIGR03083 family)